MLRTIMAIVALSTAVAPWPTGPESAASPSHADPRDPTTDAWSMEAFDRAVAGPVATIRANGRAAGDRQFETLLGSVGDNPTERTRLLTAYAMALIQTQDEAAGLTFLKRAAEEARRAFPADSRQLAMALADYAQIALEVEGDAVSPEVERMAQEAYRIRIEAVGLGHDETRVSRATLNRIAELPSRIQGDPYRLAIASWRYEAVFEPRIGRQLEPWDVQGIAKAWIAMLIANRRPDLACDALVRVQVRTEVNGYPQLGRNVGANLRDAGYARQAAPLLLLPSEPDVRMAYRGPPPFARCAP